MRKFAVIMLFILSSCAVKRDLYEAPENRPSATLLNFNSQEGSFDHTWISSSKVKVDGKRLYPMRRYDDGKMPIEPGKRLVTAEVSFNNSLWDDCPCGKEFLIEFEPKAGVDYKLNAKQDNDQVSTWIEDSQGAIVSQIYTGKHEAIKNNEVYLYIPSGR